MKRWTGWCMVVLAIGTGVPAQARPGPKAPALGPESLSTLGDTLRLLILESIPDPLHEDTHHWGNQREVANGLKWHKKGILLKPEVTKVPKNDGIWWKVKVTSPLLPNTLRLALSDPQQTEAGKLAFTVNLCMDCEIDYDRQNWKAGLRLFSVGVRAKMRLWLTMRCEVETRLEKGKSFIPDAIITCRVTHSNARYDNLTVEHIMGIGGDAAELLGDALHSTVKLIRPNLERKLLDKANAAILKAGNNKEVRVSLSKLLGQ
jgi:hypothetical protein